MESEGTEAGFGTVAQTHSPEIGSAKDRWGPMRERRKEICPATREKTLGRLRPSFSSSFNLLVKNTEELHCLELLLFGGSRG